MSAYGQSRALRLTLAVLLMTGACSRAKPERRTGALAPPSAPAYGPRVDLAGSAEPSAPVAPAGLPVLDGPALLKRIAESGSKGVVINAWASWCDPCREELPMLARVAPRLAALGVPIWLVSVDDPDGFAAARELLDSLHIDVPSFAAAPPLQAFKQAMNPGWPGMIPVSFLFDGTGKLRYFWAGEVYESELLPIVEGFAAGKHIDGVSNFGRAPGGTRGPGHE